MNKDKLIKRLLNTLYTIIKQESEDAQSSFFFVRFNDYFLITTDIP